MSLPGIRLAGSRHFHGRYCRGCGGRLHLLLLLLLLVVLLRLLLLLLLLLLLRLRLLGRLQLPHPLGATPYPALHARGSHPVRLCPSMFVSAAPHTTSAKGVTEETRLTQARPPQSLAHPPTPPPPPPAACPPLPPAAAGHTPTRSRLTISPCAAEAEEGLGIHAPFCASQYMSDCKEFSEISTLVCFRCAGAEILTFQNACLRCCRCWGVRGCSGCCQFTRRPAHRAEDT